MKTVITIVVTLVVAAVGFMFLAGRAGMSMTPQVPKLTIRGETVSPGTLLETVSAPGTVRARVAVSISSRISARIDQLPFEAGKHVKPGDVLVKLDSTDLDATLRAAKARFDAQEQQIKVAEVRVQAQEAQSAVIDVQLMDARRELKRQVDLLASADVSQQAVDQAQAKVDQLASQLIAQQRQAEAESANLEVLRHEVEAADAEIARSRDALSYTTITSPISGMVTRVNAEVGELVITGTMNNAGTVILEVADLSEMIVKARVDEGVIASVKIGQPATVRMQAYPGRKFPATVRTVALAETEVTRDGSKHYECELLLDTGGTQVLSGLNADVDIEIAKHEQVLRVPSQSVVGRNVDDLPEAARSSLLVDRSKTIATVVYRIVEGKSVVTPVRVGASDLAFTVVEAGLSQGDRVVSGPYKILESITDGAVLTEEAATTQPAPASTGPAAATASAR